MAVKQVFNTSAELDFPNVLPTLDLDFANSKTLDPRITFTRSSGGSYVGADGLIKYAGVNEARFDHDPETGESLGLLIEEARTNNVVSSQDFTTLWFFDPGGNSRIISNAILSPSGNLDGSKFVEGTANQENYIRSSARTLSAGTYTASVYVHESSERRLWLRPVHIGSTHPTSAVIFDPKTKALGSPSGFGISASATNAGGGWWRVSLTFTTPDTRNIQHGINAITSTSVYTGDGTSGLYIWGAQLETGAFPTSYIPTQASTRTRAVDFARITDKNFSEFYNQSEGTLLIDTFKGVPNTTNGFSAALVTSGLNYIGLDYTLSPNFCGPSYWRNNPTTTEILTLSPGRVYPDNGGKYVVAYKINDFAATAVGGPVTEIRPTQPIPTATTLHFGGQSLNAFVRRKIHFRRVTYFPKRLPNSQLISLTT
jgi:hypothetical protein